MTEAVNNIAPSAPDMPKAVPLPVADTRADSVSLKQPDYKLHISHCKTFGEKAFSGVFDWGINFGVNLALSAAFTHYVKHSSKPIWQNATFGKSFFHEAPEHAFQNVRQWMQKTTGFSENTAARMADALTLTTAGTGIMIPSVWLGAKCKEGFVNAADNMYYGKEVAAKDTWIASRHKQIEEEPKATLAGAVVGRIGTMAAVQITAATIGSNTNLFKKLGDSTNIKWMQKFEGLDYYSKKIGHAAGTAITDAMPNASVKLDRYSQRIGFRHSFEQIEADRSLHLGTPYTGTLADYSRYTSLDTMYTGVTMFTIHPIINFVKSFIPGMTYNNTPQEKPSNKVLAIRSQGKITAPEVSQGVAV